MLTSHHAGMTIIELMTVLTVSSILLAFGAPAAGQWLRDVEVRSSAGALLAALQSARAEAVARNAPVRLRLVDAQGRPGWEVGCVQVTARCPATIRRQPVSAATDVRWGASPPANMPALTAAIAAGTGLPAGITFDALGAAAAVGSGTDISRVDVTHARDDSARRLVLLIAAQGMVRLCDPVAATSRPERCR
ncbi:MAG: GspH/FimT family pseudopilin [Burkholderiaceae bacterium]|nr:GspH/FimT family pseudopilin [Burkholderiaceae bacterium]